MASLKCLGQAGFRAFSFSLALGAFLVALTRNRLRTAHWLSLLLLVLPVAGFAQTATGVGFVPIAIHDPVGGGTMPGYVFYPSAQAHGDTWRGPYRLAASADARPIAGAKPLVVISHGHGGSDLGHHDLATYLAAHGFVVATLTHPRDNFRDNGGSTQAGVLVGRPIQVSATIDYVLHDPHLSALVDPHRIGVAGFSAGGYTALMLVGAVPRFARIIGYCKAHPGDKGVCDGEKQLEAEDAKDGLTLQQNVDRLQRSLHRWGRTADPRVKAAFVMAPFSVPFGKAGLSQIKRPVLLYYAQNDRILWPKYNALQSAPLIKTLAGLKVVPKAGHYVFLSPCSPQLAQGNAEICQDPPGVDRISVHRRIDADALTFFRNTLGS